MADIAKYRELLQNAPLAVNRGSDGPKAIIPAALTPMVVSSSEWDALRADGFLILQVMQKFLRWLGSNATVAARLFAELGPLEKEAAWQAVKSGAMDLASMRFDLFRAAEGWKIIEANTTIPAMSAYSDMIAESFVKASEDRAIFKNLEAPCNSTMLLESILFQYQRCGGKSALPKIAIIARENDSQVAELRWLQRVWEGRGHHVHLGTPDDITTQSSQVLFRGESVDCVYRHVFASRLDPASDFAKACLNASEYKIFNPISAHLEAKGFLAEMLRLAPHLELNSAEHQALTRRMPWTRLLQRGPDVAPDGEQVADLVQWLCGNRARVVVKAHIGYGGHEVVIGRDFDSDSTQAKLGKLMGKKHLFWPEWIESIADEPARYGLWVAQEAMPGLERSLRFITTDAEDEAKCWVDLSMFLTTGGLNLLTGGASRFAPNRIVNIGTGGGLVPLFIQT